jgi:hypothetical protein
MRVLVFLLNKFSNCYTRFYVENIIKQQDQRKPNLSLDVVFNIHKNIKHAIRKKNSFHGLFLIRNNTKTKQQTHCVMHLDLNKMYVINKK